MIGVEDDEDVILLEGKAASLLRELQECDAWLAANRPTQYLPPGQLKAYRMQRQKRIAQKNRVVAEYRATKAALKGRRRELKEAACDVERDLTDPEDLIAALLGIAVAAGAWRTTEGQETIDAAERYLGVSAAEARHG